MNILWIILGVVVLFLFYLWSTYNNLVVLKNRINEAGSGIDVQLKRRTDLIPNLVSTVKGYATHEKSVFEEVTKARSDLMSAKTMPEKQAADNALSGALKSLFAVAEAYPELKANSNFQQLQSELSDTEDKVAYSRQFYNSNVLTYNNSIAVFPNNLLAGMFHFNVSEFFETAEKDREPVKVQF